MSYPLTEAEARIAVAGLELAAWAVAPPHCPDCDFSDGGGGPCPAHVEAVEASADYAGLAAALQERLPPPGPKR